MTKKPAIKTNKSRKLELVVRDLEKKVEPHSASQAAGGSCARVYCL